MILELRKSFDPVLKKKSKEVKNINEEEKKFSQDLIETMVKKDGIGIASPQIGVLKKIIPAITPNSPSHNVCQIVRLKTILSSYFSSFGIS